jgi:hypothetical protein
LDAGSVVIAIASGAGQSGNEYGINGPSNHLSCGGRRLGCIGWLMLLGTHFGIKSDGYMVARNPEANYDVTFTNTQKYEIIVDNNGFSLYRNNTSQKVVSWEKFFNNF